MEKNNRKDRYRVGKAYVTISNPERINEQVKAAVLEKRGGYITMSDVRSIAYADKHNDYCQVINNSLFTFTDGMPLIWMARLWGIKENQRTPGPILFVNLISENNSDLRHFLLGDTEETLSAIKKKFPSTNIVKTFSPPFCGVDKFDYEAIAKMINDTDANIVWVALHAPKQDYFAARLAPLLTDGKVCIDVGAAFRFALGQYKMPPKYAQKLGIIGLFWRKFNFALLKWYFVHTGYVIKWSGDIIISRIKGKCYCQ